MPAHKKPRNEVKIPFTVGVKRGTVIAFEKLMEDLDLNKSNTVESLMEDFLKQMK